MKRQQGFTLIELIIGVVIASILFAYGVPAYQNFIRQSRLTGGVNNFVTALNQARAEAVKRGRAVTICTSVDANSCTAGDYADGWIVFAEAGLDVGSLGARSADEELISVDEGVGADFDLNGSGIGTALSFLPDGTGTQSGFFVLCHEADINFSRAVFINAMGRVVQGSDDNGNGIPEDISGNDLGGCL